MRDICTCFGTRGRFVFRSVAGGEYQKHRSEEEEAQGEAFAFHRVFVSFHISLQKKTAFCVLIIHYTQHHVKRGAVKIMSENLAQTP